MSQNQLILNAFTCFEVYVILKKTPAPPNPVITQIRKLYVQQFFSKVPAICKGPVIDGADTFFAARDSDVVLFHYSPIECIFIAARSFSLPYISCPPSSVYFGNDVLVISSIHGALVAIDTSTDNSPTVFEKKTTNCVLTSFLVDDDHTARYEAGIVNGPQPPTPNIVIYQHRPFEVEKKYPMSPRAGVTDIFRFKDGFIICTRAQIRYQVDGMVQHELSLSPDHVIAHCVMPNGMSTLLLTETNSVYKLDFSFNMTPLIRPNQIQGILRLLPIDDDTFMMCTRSQQHQIWSVNVIPRPGGTSAPTRIGHIPSLVGSQSLFMGSQSLVMAPQSHSMGMSTNSLAPHFITACGQQVIVGYNGLTTQYMGRFDLNEKTTGLFTFKSNDKQILVISYTSSTRFVELDGNTEIRPCDQFVYRDNLPTIGIAQFNSRITVQITPELYAIVQPKQPDGSSKPLKFVQMKISNYDANATQLLLVAENENRIHFYAVLTNTHFAHVIPGKITAVALEPIGQEKQYADYYAIAVTVDSNNSYLSVRRLSSETADPEEIVRFATRMPINSICFFNPTTLVIGEEGGGVMIARLDVEGRFFHDIQLFKLGTDDVRLVKAVLPGIMFALSTSSWLLRERRGIVTPQRLVHTALSFVVPVYNLKQMWAVAISGAQLIVIGIDAGGNQFAIQSTVPMKTPITDVVALSTFPAVIAAVNNSLPFINLSSLSDTNIRPIEAFRPKQNEIITKLVIGALETNPYHRQGLAISLSPQPGERGSNSFRIVLMQLAFSQQPLAIQPSVIATSPDYQRKLTALACRVSCVVCACDNFVMLMKPTDNVLQLIATLSNVGISIKHLAFVHPYRMYTECIAAGDVQRSYCILELDEQTYSLRVAAEEGVCRQITALTPYQDSFIGGDVFGNIFQAAKYQPVSPSIKQGIAAFPAPARLSTTFNFNVGDVITGVSYSQDTFRFIWYITIAGGFGGILMPIRAMKQTWVIRFDKVFFMFRLLEAEMQSLYFKLTKCDNIAHRARNFPNTNIIDLDVIDIFTIISQERKTELIARVNEQLAKYGMKYTQLDVEIEICRMKTYFSQWGTNYKK